MHNEYTPETRGAQSAPHPQHQQQRQQRHELAEDLATAAAYLAESLAVTARRKPTVQTARIACDALTVATLAHRLAAEVWAQHEGEVAA